MESIGSFWTGTKRIYMLKKKNNMGKMEWRRARVEVSFVHMRGEKWLLGLVLTCIFLWVQLQTFCVSQSYLYGVNYWGCAQILHGAHGNVNWYNWGGQFGNSFLNEKWIYSFIKSFQDTYLTDIFARVKLCKRILIIVLLLIVEDWKQSKCLSIGSWLYNLWYTHAMAYYTVSE